MFNQSMKFAEDQDIYAAKTLFSLLDEGNQT